VAASAWKTVELAGLPGIGKTTVARAMVDLIDVPNVRTRTGARHRSDTLRAVAQASVRPAQLGALWRVSMLIFRGVDSSWRPRARRAWKVAKALARIGSPTPRSLIFDEGPLTWIVAARWRDSSLRATAIREVADFYGKSRCALVVLEGSVALASERLDRRAAGAARTRRGAPGLIRVGLRERADLMADAFAGLGDQVHAIHLTVRRDNAPTELAAEVLDALGLPAPRLSPEGRADVTVESATGDAGVFPVARPTLYMIVEIKVRELRAKLLLAQKLADRGFRVYVGSRDAVMTALKSKSQRAGVYYFKGGEPLGAFAEARRRCDFVVGQDEEIGPALSPDDVERAWRTRYSTEIAEMIDGLFIFSSAHLEMLQQVLPGLAAKAEVTGWPRADLWKPGMSAVDADKADRIRREFGEFVLFASNFKVSSEIQRDHAVAFAERAHDAGPDSQWDDGAVMRDASARASHRLESFRRTVAFLRDVADEADAPIVVRPHPAESPSDWIEALDGTPGVRVIAEGAAGPWLMAARGVLHAGCTTAVEAAFYGVPCGYLDMIRYQSQGFVETASWQASTNLPDLDATVRFVHSAMSGSLARDASELPEDAFGPQEGLASERIAHSIAQLDVSPEPPLPRRRGVVAKRLAARVIASWLDRPRAGARFTGTNAQRKLPGGIHTPEVRQVLASFGDTDLVKVHEPAFDLVCIER